jgi:hypothetical protein
MALTNTQILDLVETAIQTVAAGGISSYEINGRAVTRMDTLKLLQARDNLLAAIARENVGSFGVGEFRSAR